MKQVRTALFGLGVVAAGALGTKSVLEGATQGTTVQAPRFEVDPMWPKPLPYHWLLGSTTGIAIDSRDHVYVIHLTDSFTARTETGSGPANNNITPAGECCSSAPNVLEFDPAGNLVASWGGPGQGYDWPAQNAGIAIDPSGNLWIGGIGGSDTRVLKFAKDGKFVAQYGIAGQAPPPAAAAAADTAYAGQSPARGQAQGGRGGGRGGRGGRGGAPALPAASTNTERFGGASGFAFSGSEVYVADGSRNRRVAVVDMNTGSIKRFFGAYGAAPDDAMPTTYSPNDPPSKQFSGVRCVETATDGTIYVCDARNNRIQVFGKDGQFVKEARLAPNTLAGGSVWDIAFSRDAQQRYLYVADGSNMKVHVVDRQTLDLLTSFGEGGRLAGQFLAVSGVATDSKGNLYTVEGSEGKRLQKFVFKGVGSVSRNQGVLWPK